jgi:predicted amidohydrolase YtcJ
MDTTVWIHGNFITMDPYNPRVQALVVSGDRIAFAGNVPEALSRASADATIRELGGKTVVPGFNDNHVHAVFMGDHVLAADLQGLDSLDIVQLLAERFPSPEPGIVLRAFNWDYPACPAPRKEILDKAFPRNPVVLGQFSGHAHWLNSAALRVLGISRDSPDPAHGQVLRDADGEPTGIVRDLGETPLSHLRVQQTYYRASEREPRLAIALATFRKFGITSVQDNAWYSPQVASLLALRAEGRLTARFSLMSLGRDANSRRGMDRALRKIAPSDAHWIARGPVKYFLDGAFSTRTACLCEPYADDPEAGVCAEPAEARAELEYLARSRRRGAFHIIGDRGIAIFLDTAESVWKRRPVMRELRIRIEHAQLVRERDIERIARLGILVAAQPSALGSPEKDERLLGRERAARAYPYRSLLEAGVRLSFGSDIPGESTCDPIASIHMAVNRNSPEKIGLMDALRCYTLGSAYAECAEDRKGMLKSGMLADFAVLSDDISALAPEKIAQIRVLETVSGGASVYRLARALPD